MSVKVGDKIRYTGPSGDDLTQGKVYEVEGVLARGLQVLDDVGDYNGIAQCYYEPVTDTPPAPTLWQDMTDAQKGALLLAHDEGKVIEYHGLPPGEWFADFEFDPQEYPDIAYRVAEPGPRRLTVDLMADFKVIGTIDLIDGKPDPDSIKMEELT